MGKFHLYGDTVGFAGNAFNPSANAINLLFKHSNGYYYGLQATNSGISLLRIEPDGTNVVIWTK